MKKLVIGTGNPGKVAKIKAALSSLNLEIISSGESGLNLEIPETGLDVEANARLKALAYRARVNLPVLCIDSSFYLDGLPPEEQPGLKMRRLREEQSATDEELLAHYTALIERLGGQGTALIRDGFCLALSSHRVFTLVVETKRFLVTPPCSERVIGHPLDSLQFDQGLKKYFAQMTPPESQALWQKLIGLPLTDFLRGHLFGSSFVIKPVLVGLE